MEHFSQYMLCQRSLSFFLLDGHSTPNVARYGKENHIIMLCLPPHTTHETQPLDCGVFAPLKSHWTWECHDFIQRNPGKVITKCNFLFSQAWLRAVTPSNIISAFRTCGVYHTLMALKRMNIQCRGNYQKRQSNTSCATFTDDQVQLFTRRFEKGFDVDDAEYSCWLQVHHAEQTTDAGLSLSSQVSPQTELQPVHESTHSSSTQTLPCQNDSSLLSSFFQ